MQPDIFIPNKEMPISEDNVWKWYLNISRELDQSFFSTEDRSYFAKYYRDAGLLRSWRRPFFRHHYSRTFSQAANHLFSEQKVPRILDLGCGTGTQTLFFCLLGASVIGVDMDDKALGIMEKRREFYEKWSDRTLSIEIHNSNAFEFDYDAIEPIDGIYSMFAFNMMQPSRRLLDLILAHTSERCCFAVLDGNSTSWKSRLIPSCRRKGRLSPRQFEKELNKHSFKISKHVAGFAMPPMFWCLLPGTILRRFDNMLGSYWMLAISHQILAKKNCG